MKAHLEVIGIVGDCETGEYNQINGSNGLHMTMKVTETLKTRFDDHQQIVFLAKNLFRTSTGIQSIARR